MKESAPKNKYSTYKQSMYYKNRSDGNSMIKAEYAGFTFPTSNINVVSDGRYTSFEYIIRGNVYIDFDGNTYTAHEGDVYIIKQGIMANYYTKDDEKAEKIFVSMKGRLLDKLFEAYDLTDSVIISHCNVEDEIRKIHSVLYTANDSPEATYKLSLYVHEIIMKISMAKQTADFQFNPGSQLVDSLKSYIDSGLHFNVSLKRLAKHFKASEKYLIYIFKKKYGISPYAYLIKMRIRTAEQMLTDTNLTVKEIAAKLSFSDSNYFSNAFKKHTGMSPKNYRKAYKKTE